MRRVCDGVEVIEAMKEIELKSNRVIGDVIDEIRALKKLKGATHVVQVKTLQMKDATHFLLFMEYLDGLDGLDFSQGVRGISAGNYFPIEMAGAIVKELLLGLQEIHGKGMIHSDMKLPNVQIGMDGKVTIIDFGGAIAQGSKIKIHTKWYAQPEYFMFNPFEDADLESESKCEPKDLKAIIDKGERALPSYDVYSVGMMTLYLFIDSSEMRALPESLIKMTGSSIPESSARSGGKSDSDTSGGESDSMSSEGESDTDSEEDVEKEKSFAQLLKRYPEISKLIQSVSEGCRKIVEKKLAEELDGQFTERVRAAEDGLLQLKEKYGENEGYDQLMEFLQLTLAPLDTRASIDNLMNTSFIKQATEMKSDIGKMVKEASFEKALQKWIESKNANEREVREWIKEKATDPEFKVTLQKWLRESLTLDVKLEDWLKKNVRNNVHTDLLREFASK